MRFLTPTMLRKQSYVILTTLVIVFLGFDAFAQAPSLFRKLAGSWRGSGELTLADNTRERISCRGYYVLKDGNGLSAAILCNSPNYKVEIRSRLTERQGGIRGSWEERVFNATGDVSGHATANRLDLSISGTIQGSLSISSPTNARRHSVTISTAGIGFKRVQISLVPD